MDDLIQEWKKEEQMPFAGWDFSYLKGKMTEEKPPWDYKSIAKEYLSKSRSVLDMGTGGGEIFASLAPFPPHTVAIEGFHPNYLLAKQKLERLGVKVVYVHETSQLPFKPEEFDLVLNRHSGINVHEIARVLSKGGIFLTQQVDGTSNIDLMRIFGVNPKWPDSTLEINEKKFEEAGFTILEKQNWEGKTIFGSVSALVYYLKSIPWTVPDFSVHKYLEELKKLQEKTNEGGELSFSNKRYLIVARKN